MDGCNYVAQLNELAQKTRQSLTYEEISVNGPDHDRKFTMRVVLNNDPYPDGVGRNKKEAKQDAAKKALQKLNGRSTQLNNSESKMTSQAECPSPTPVNNPVKQANYTCWLNEYGQKNRLTINSIEATKCGPANTTQCCRFVIEDKEYPEAFGNTKKEAKEEAARLVYLELHKETGTVGGTEDKGAASEMDEPSNSMTELSPTTNYIGILNQYCQKTKMVLDFKLVHRSGPAHKPEFVYKVSMNGKEYPEGQGKSAKEGKQQAAKLAWEDLQESSEWNSQLSFKSNVSEDSDVSDSSSPCNSETSGTLEIHKESTSDFIVFKDSSTNDSPKIKTTPRVTKSRTILAPNFKISPVIIKQESNNFRQAAGVTTTQSRFLQDYDQIARIGKGGFGHVFKARRKLEDRFFAVKIVKSTSKSLREVGALVDLQHPNIVRYYSSWEEDTEYTSDSSESSSNSSSDASAKFLYIQMELCDTNNLRGWIAGLNGKKKSCRREDALRIVQQVVEGVEFIHSKNLIHRDLKPANILFGNDGKVKIGDFGLVTCAENESDEVLLKRTTRTGTRPYMSPEQLWKNIRDRKFPKPFCDKYSTEHKLVERMLAEDPEERPDASEIRTGLETIKTLLLKEKPAHGENRTV